jgi:molybdopterin molybdotransferase
LPCRSASAFRPGRRTNIAASRHRRPHLHRRADSGEGADAVVMQERCEHGENGVVINQLPRLEENIRPRRRRYCGRRRNPQAWHPPAPAGHRAGCFAAGLPELPVYRRVRVGVFFTGDELVQPGEPLPPGGIYNSNRYALRALLEGLGCEVRDLGTVPDNFEATRDALRRAAADNDLIVTSGGVSVGEEDHVKPAVEAEGQLDMWKIAIKPGKPLAFGDGAPCRPWRNKAKPGSSACRVTRCRPSSPS